MGLSNEERYEKTLYTLRALRKELDTNWSEHKLQSIGASYFEYEVRKTIDSIIGSTHELSGIILSLFDRSSGYWLFGESENGLKGYTTGYFNPNTVYMGEDKDVEQVHDLSIRAFASHLGFDRTLIAAALWWDLYSYIPALLYPVQRYEDDCFSEKFHKEFNKLLSLIFELKPEVKINEEKVLLIKHNFFVEEYGYEKIEWEKLEELHNKYRNINQQELCEMLDKKRTKKSKSETDYNKKEQDKKNDKINPVLGVVKEEPKQREPKKKKKK